MYFTFKIDDILHHFSSVNYGNINLNNQINIFSIVHQSHYISAYRMYLDNKFSVIILLLKLFKITIGFFKNKQSVIWGWPVDLWLFLSHLVIWRKSMNSKLYFSKKIFTSENKGWLFLNSKNSHSPISSRLQEW